ISYQLKELASSTPWHCDGTARRPDHARKSESREDFGVAASSFGPSRGTTMRPSFHCAGALALASLIVGCGRAQAPLPSTTELQAPGRSTSSSSRIARVQAPGHEVHPDGTSANDPSYGGGAVLTDVQVASVYWGAIDSSLMSTLPGFF